MVKVSLKNLPFKPKSIPQFVLSEVLPSVDCGFFWFLREYLKIQHNHIFRHDWYATFQSILVFKKYSDFLYSIILYNYLKYFEIIFVMIILQAIYPFCMDQITLIKWKLSSHACKCMIQSLFSFLYLTAKTPEFRQQFLL